MSENEKNMQITLGDDNIDRMIEQLKKMKNDNNLIVRLGGDHGGPELLMVHRNFKVSEKEEKKKKQD